MFTMPYSILIWSMVLKYGGSACDSHTVPGPLPASSPLFVKLELLKLNDIFNLHVSMFIHKCLYHQISENSKHNYLTRHNYNNPSNVIATNSIFIPLARTTNYGLKMLKVKGPKIWNSLPSGIRITKSPYCFKKLLKSHFLSLY